MAHLMTYPQFHSGDNTMARTKGSTNITTNLQKRITSLEGLIERQDQAVEQGLDEIAELRKQVDFYRKQVNHLIALLNIITRGA
jgi:uncharacterized coiled-coil protein SlyX